MNPVPDSPLVSIALATFNGESFLDEQLDSLVNQTYKNLEIIISDDGSTDTTLTILQNYAARHAHIRILKNQGEKGIRGNFTHALQSCRGELIALCDQDDIWMPDKIRKMVERIGPASLIFHDSLLVDEQGLSLHRNAVEKPFEGKDPRPFLLRNVASGHAILFRSELLQKIFPFPPVRHHDWWIAAVAADENGIEFLPEVLVHFRQHNLNASDFLEQSSERTSSGAGQLYLDEIVWFQNFTRLRTQTRFFRKWYLLNKARSEKWLCFDLFVLCFTNRDSLFFLFRKNRWSKISRSLKYLWGFKLKRIFNRDYAVQG